MLGPKSVFFFFWQVNLTLFPVRPKFSQLLVIVIQLVLTAFNFYFVIYMHENEQQEKYNLVLATSVSYGLTILVIIVSFCAIYTCTLDNLSFWGTTFL